MSKMTIVVTRDQIESAQALIRISGVSDKVDPLIRKIAEAMPRRADGNTGRKDS
ncbi:hypothetical protein [Jatrophihabitans fulvus]